LAKTAKKSISATFIKVKIHPDVNIWRFFMGNSSLGLSENIAGALTYLLGFITGIIFLLIEKNNKFVRFHAMQSTILFIVIFVIDIILSITIIGLLLVPVVGLISLILWLFLMYQAFTGKKFKLPVIGDMAEKNA
jgi:uncharacterized membrane protein